MAGRMNCVANPFHSLCSGYLFFVHSFMGTSTMYWCDFSWLTLYLLQGSLTDLADNFATSLVSILCLMNEMPF